MKKIKRDVGLLFTLKKKLFQEIKLWNLYDWYEITKTYYCLLKTKNGELSFCSFTFFFLVTILNNKVWLETPYWLLSFGVEKESIHISAKNEGKNLRNVLLWCCRFTCSLVWPLVYIHAKMRERRCVTLLFCIRG